MAKRCAIWRSSAVSRDGGLTMYRYFIGVRPPPDQSILIAGVMNSLGDQWPVPHITVKDPDGLTPDLKWLSKVRALAVQSPRFDLTIGAPCTFDDRVLYLSVEGAALERLHNDIAKLFSPAGSCQTDSTSASSFTPHLTLLVARKGHDLPPIGAWASLLDDLDTFEVSELIVFRRDVPSTHYQPWVTLPLTDVSLDGQS